MTILHADANRGHASNEKRNPKGLAILNTVSTYIDGSLNTTKWLDIGCGSGGIAAAIAPSVKDMIGWDIHSWYEWTEYQDEHKNLRFELLSIDTESLDLPLYDVVICNQVYEHVSDPELLIRKIYANLKPGGICYFAGPNLIFPIEPHIFWPFIHWLPRTFAVRLLQLFGSKAILDANSTHYWKLKSWLFGFEITNAIPYVIKHSALYRDSSWLGSLPIWRLIQYIPDMVLHFLTPLSPGFIFILRKPREQYTEHAPRK